MDKARIKEQERKEKRVCSYVREGVRERERERERGRWRERERERANEMERE